MAKESKFAKLRADRRAQGYKETTIWLNPEAESALVALIERHEFKNRSEAVQFALITAFKMEHRK